MERRASTCRRRHATLRVQLGTAGIWAEQRQHGRMPAEAFRNLEKDNAVPVIALKMLESNNISIEGHHVFKIGTTDGDFAKRSDTKAALERVNHHSATKHHRL